MDGAGQRRGRTWREHIAWHRGGPHDGPHVARRSLIGNRRHLRRTNSLELLPRITKLGVVMMFAREGSETLVQILVNPFVFEAAGGDDFVTQRDRITIER